MEQQQLEVTSPDQVDNSDNKSNSSKISENSEKFHEMAAATESPPKQCFLLDDDGEFPPMNKGSPHKD